MVEGDPVGAACWALLPVRSWRRLPWSISSGHNALKVMLHLPRPTASAPLLRSPLFLSFQPKGECLGAGIRIVGFERAGHII